MNSDQPFQFRKFLGRERDLLSICLHRSDVTADHLGCIIECGRFCLTESRYPIQLFYIGDEGSGIPVIFHFNRYYLSGCQWMTFISMWIWRLQESLRSLLFGYPARAVIDQNLRSFDN